MKKVLFTFLIVLVYLSSFSQTNYYGRPGVFKLPRNSSAADYLPNTVIVKFKQAPSASAKTRSAQPALSLSSATVTSLVQKFPQGGNGTGGNTILREADKAGINRIYELKYSGDAGIERVVNELLSSKDIEYAEPYYVHHTYYTPNDPLYAGRQSYLNQVQAPEAWEIIRNSTGVVIGIVDSGSELGHEDLQANIAGGWDLIGADANNFTEDNDPDVKRAENDHGVHVSGLASAVTDNGRGVASIAFNARLLIVKVAADNRADDIYRGYDGIKYAADHGANIINCSWGSTNRSFYGEDIINYAISRGCLIVAAGGNNATDTPDYPAGYKGVIAVANVRDNDVKAPSSNYGGYISISAPGSNIFNTTYQDSYGVKSGTSMAAPIVSSAAALVKSHFPELDMQQVGELLRVTSDNIDNLNPSYAGMLGKGRLNVYRALTERAPSIRYQEISFEDANNGKMVAGSTVAFYLDLKNFLLPATNLRVSLESTHPNVVVSGSQTIASLGTMEVQERVGPFNVFIQPGTADNTPVEFRLRYQANDVYQDYETFTVVVARDYFNIITENLSTTVTSNGRIGYSSPDQQDGLGFQYKGSQLLYESALMVGNSTSLSNNARTSSGNVDEHFIKRISVRESVTDSTISGSSEFDDAGNERPLNIDVKHTLSAFKNSSDLNYVVAEYEVVNRNPTSLNGIYIGTFNDWDIADEASNATSYDAINRIAYAYSPGNAAAPYAGVKLLSTNAAPAYYPLSLGGSVLGDDNFTQNEKYLTLSSGVSSSGIGDNSSGQDISFVSGYGPFNIPANGSVKVAFAYGGADNLAQLQSALAKAQTRYQQVVAPAGSELVLSSYPNPVTPYHSNNVAAVLNLPADGVISLDLYNIMGQRVKSLVNQQPLVKGAHTLYYDFADVGSGIYLLRLNYNNSFITHKISVVK